MKTRIPLQWVDLYVLNAVSTRAALNPGSTVDIDKLIHEALTVYREYTGKMQQYIERGEVIPIPATSSDIERDDESLHAKVQLL